MFGLLFGDNYYEVPRTAVGRASGAHRVATLLRNRGIKVEVIDFFNSWTDEELEKYVHKCPEINFLGIGCTLSQLNYDKLDKVINLVKSKNPEVKVIAGGSSVLDQPYPSVDLYFKGFIEGAVDEVVRYLEHGKVNPFIVDTIKTQDIRKVIDCTKKFPNLDLTNLRTLYTESDFIQPTESLTVETSRGCIFKCKFCSFPLVGKKKNDYIREKEDVKRELLYNYNTWGITKYSITDDTFNDNDIKVDMLYEIAGELDFELNFISYARIDLLRAKPGSLEKLVKSGVKGVFFGIESLHEEASRAIGKGLTGAKLKSYLLEIKEKFPNLHLSGSFIAGLPYEPGDVFEANIEWALENNIFHSYNFFPLGIPIDNKVNYVSPFSTEWPEFGYEIMTPDEINEALAGIDTNVSKIYAKYEDFYKHHSLPWKNNQMNFLQAIVIAERCKRKAHGNSTVNGWTALAQSFNKDNVIGALHAKKTEVDWHKQAQDTHEFVETYKAKKLAYIETT